MECWLPRGFWWSKKGPYWVWGYGIAMPAIQPLGLFLVKYTIDKKWWIPVSRILNKAECNYCVTDKEWLVFKYFIQYFISIWQEDIFVVCTDHQPQRWLFSLKATRGQIARWLEIIASYDFSIKYRKGTKHGYVDAMSQSKGLWMCAWKG